MKIIKRILDFIKKYHRFLITAHARADGDALGSELAFAAWLTKMGKTGHIINTGGFSEIYRFLPGIKKIKEINSPIKKKYDALVVLDSGGFDRLEKIRDFLPPGLPILNIDHHPSNDNFGEINWVAPKMSSVGEMVYQLIKASGVPLDKKMALNLYVSLITDTGNFCFASTTSSSHLMAGELLSYKINLREIIHNIYEEKPYGQVVLFSEAVRRMKLEFGGKVIWTELTRAMYKQFQAQPDDSQEYLRVLKSVKGTLIAILFRETPDPREGIKVSIRTEPPINANLLTKHFGGGGHYRAAGCTIYQPLPQTRQLVLNYVKKYLGKK